MGVCVGAHIPLASPPPAVSAPQAILRPRLHRRHGAIIHTTTHILGTATALLSARRRNRPCLVPPRRPPRRGEHHPARPTHRLGRRRSTQGQAARRRGALARALVGDRGRTAADQGEPDQPDPGNRHRADADDDGRAPRLTARRRRRRTQAETAGVGGGGQDTPVAGAVTLLYADHRGAHSEPGGGGGGDAAERGCCCCRRRRRHWGRIDRAGDVRC